MSTAADPGLSAAQIGPSVVSAAAAAAASRASSSTASVLALGAATTGTLPNPLQAETGAVAAAAAAETADTLDKQQQHEQHQEHQRDPHDGSSGSLSLAPDAARILLRDNSTSMPLSLSTQSHSNDIPSAAAASASTAQISALTTTPTTPAAPQQHEQQQQQQLAHATAAAAAPSLSLSPPLTAETDLALRASPESVQPAGVDKELAAPSPAAATAEAPSHPLMHKEDQDTTLAVDSAVAPAPVAAAAAVAEAAAAAAASAAPAAAAVVVSPTLPVPEPSSSAQANTSPVQSVLAGAEEIGNPSPISTSTSASASAAAAVAAASSEQQQEQPSQPSQHPSITGRLPGRASSLFAPVTSSSPNNLESLPILSPISPLSASSLGNFAYTLNDASPTVDDDKTHPDPSGDSSQKTTSRAPPPPPLAPFASAASRASGDRPASIVRGAISSLSVHSASPLTPTDKISFGELGSPRLRESPSVPRRRTIIEAHPVSLQASPVRAAAEVSISPQVEDGALSANHASSPVSPSPVKKALAPQDLTSPTRERSQTPDVAVATAAAAAAAAATTSGARSPSPLVPLAFPQARVASDCTSASETRKVVSSNGESPQKKRSLPRPPSSHQESQRMSTAEPIPMAIAMPIPTVARSPPIQHQSLTSAQPPRSPPQQAPMLGLGLTAEPRGIPATRSPQQQQQSQQLSPTIQRLPLEKSQSYGSPPTVTVNNITTLKSQSMPTPVFNPGHQPTNSASNLPAIAGLADAGPYPTAPKPATRTSGGLALPGDGRPATNRPAQGLKPPEEVCLECMMRDRDLADVDVTGEGVWDRASNVAWDELKQREADLLGAMSLDHSVSGLSLEDSSSDDASEPSISSPRSQGSGLSSEEARRRAVQKKQMREARRAKRDERDAQIARLGWRGFKWEEGQAGEGFPRGFRGTRPGALTEKGIKNVMTMYPSSSTLRYQILQGYLRGQYRLILEIRSEAQRQGRYPEPEEPYFPTSPTQSSHESLTLNSVSRRAKARMSVDHVGGALNAPRSLPNAGLHPATLRQSPSTPAALGQQPVPQLTRPKSQYFPDREPSPYQQGRPSLNVNTAPQLRPSHLKGPSSSSVPKQQRDSRFEDWSDTEDLWPPASPSSGQNLRPFSFAVRAGAAGREGSDGGHSRRSFLGKWGGSVTSLFTGGTHGGSGSMMDMHLGLEMDRRNRTSSVQDFQTRAVSVHQMASPNSRPPTYMSRQSVSSSVYLTGGAPEKHLSPSVHSVQPEHRLREPPLPRPRSASATRLTQISLNDSELSHTKKKGIKGLLSKMKPKGKKERRMSQHSPSPRLDEDAGSSDLAPPPPMPFLVKSRETNRRRSTSSLSQQFMDSQASLSPPGPPPGAIPVQGTRSVSAPLAGSSGSGSISPTSSRFERGPQNQNDLMANRRRTDPPPELPPGAELFDPRRGSEGYDPRNDPRRGSTMEMLTASSNGSVPRPIISADTPVYDEPLPLNRDSVIPNGAQAPAAQLTGFVPASAQFRRSKQPSLSSRYSTSSATVPNIETPDPASSPSYLTSNGLPPHLAGVQTPMASPGITPTAGSSPAQFVNMPAQGSPPGSLSPNRYKNLPPLPPGMAISPGADVYPDLDQQSISTRASFPDAKRLSTYSANPRSSVISEAPTMHRAALPPSAEYFPTASPRYHQQAGQLAPGPGMMYMPNPMTDSPSSGGHNGVLPNQLGHPNGPPNPPWQRQIQPRPSFDSAHTRYSAVNPGMPFPMDPSAMPGGRPTHSMYINNQASASTGSFGRFLSRERHIVAASAPQTEDKKERRRGIKSIFSKAR